MLTARLLETDNLVKLSQSEKQDKLKTTCKKFHQKPNTAYLPAQLASEVMPTPPTLPSSTPRRANSHSLSQPHWYSFSHMLRRLHAEGVYLHPHQLAEFLLAHGLPVDLSHVPAHLREKAISVNTHYRGDMAALDEGSDEQPWDGYLRDFD